MVIEEIRSAAPDRQIIIAELDFIDPVYCDTNRVGQLLSNLLSNAMTPISTLQSKCAQK